jgi:hypothetical protein
MRYDAGDPRREEESVPKEPDELRPDELEGERAEPLPARKAMSFVSLEPDLPDPVPQPSPEDPEEWEPPVEPRT